MEIENYVIRLDSVEYMFVTPSDKYRSFFDLHLHFKSGGYAKIPELPENTITSVRTAFLKSGSDAVKE